MPAPHRSLGARKRPLLKQPREPIKRERVRVPPVYRFAPSPNGPLHVGHAYAALHNYDLCRRAGGRFLLRIEDIDPIRSRREHENAIYEDLAWLGLTWETSVRRQSEHMEGYRQGRGIGSQPR